MGHKDDIIKKLERRIAQLEKERGLNDKSALLLEGDPYGRYKDWQPLKDVVADVETVIEDMKARKWFWGYNWSCKYVDIRIDMRDGHAIICNQKDGRISLEQLKYQYKSSEDQ